MAEKPSGSGQGSLSSEDQISIIQANVKAEPYAIFDNFSFSGLDPMLATVQECSGFYKIISAKSQVFLPKHITNFFYNWKKTDQPKNITIHLSTPSGGDPVNVLQLIVRIFDRKNRGLVILDKITLADRQRVFKESTMGEPAFTPKAFPCHFLQPEF